MGSMEHVSRCTNYTRKFLKSLRTRAVCGCICVSVRGVRTRACVQLLLQAVCFTRLRLFVFLRFLFLTFLLSCFGLLVALFLPPFCRIRFLFCSHFYFLSAGRTIMKKLKKPSLRDCVFPFWRLLWMRSFGAIIWVFAE